MTAGVEEPNGLLTLGRAGRREPNIPATTTDLVDGIVAETQNGWPSVRFDLQAVNSLAAPLLAAGFYYKTFMQATPMPRRRPAKARGHYQPVIWL